MAGSARRKGGALKVRQVRSGIGFQQKQKDTLRSLGLRKLNQVVELPDNAAVRGMIFAVRHLVEVVDEAPEGRR